MLIRQEIELWARETCGTLGHFFAIFCCSANLDDNKSRLKSGNNKAYRFRKGLYDLSTLELEKLMQLKADYDRKQLLNKRTYD